MTKAGDSRWRDLDAPAKAAFRWAWATAMGRYGTEDPYQVQVNSADLLAGIMLADLRGNPARDLLEHFDIPPGAILRRDGFEPPSADQLLTVMDKVPGDRLPTLEDQIDVMFFLGRDLYRTSANGLASLRDIFGRLLGTRSSAMISLRNELADRRVHVDRLITEYAEYYLTSRMSYKDYLRQRFPYQPPQVELPSYLPDQPDGLPDLVGIGADVDAFAYLIASTRLAPPLAIGLFGEWGAGKSYFLRSLQRRVNSVAGADPFHRHIVQIEFNAWQYVGGDLWASLLEHLFRNLRRSGDDSDHLIERRRQYWINEVQGAQAKQDKAEQLVTQRRANVAELEERRRKDPFAGWRPSPELIQQIADTTGVEIVGERAEELTAGLRQARDALRGAGAVLTPLRTGGWHNLVAVLLLLITPAVLLVLQLVNPTGLAAAAATVASVIASIAGYVRLAGNVIRTATKKLAEAESQLAAEEAKQREEVADAERQLADARSTLDDLRTKLAASTPRRVLGEFIADRLASEDYRSHLGVPALVRRDLERLSQLVAAQHANPGSAVPDEYAIDRIVLYIDDLDRCPTDLVIKVLEAVHLLLAFPLFVVVVGVDPRWLESSLKQHYSQLAGNGAQPEDYLEKIFQVPFRMPALPVDVRQGMLRGFLTPSLVTDFSDQPSDRDGVAPDVRPLEVAEFRKVVKSLGSTQRTSARSLAVRALAVTDDEMAIVEPAAELIGSTPRAVKRFVNTYLLAKSMGVNRGWTVPGDGQVAILLAVATGLPKLADVLLPYLTRQPIKPRSLADVLRELDALDQIGVLIDWLDRHPPFKQVDMSGLADWIGIIGRFRFRR